MLLNCMGDEYIDIFYSFKLSTENIYKFDTVIEFFNNNFEPKKIAAVILYNFNKVLLSVIRPYYHLNVCLLMRRLKRFSLILDVSALQNLWKILFNSI